MFNLFNLTIFKNLKLRFGKKKSKGGDAGNIFIAAKKIMGTGSIEANGGDGNIGGKGGKITVISDDNRFEGKISAEGGKSK